jgi:hypothetical protein
MDVTKTKLKEFYGNLLDKNSKTYKIAIVLLVLTVIVSVVLLYKRYKRNQRLYPKLYTFGKLGSKRDEQENSVIVAPLSNNEFSYSTWIYLNSLDYRYGQWKHVFTKGISEIGSLEQCPSLWIHPKKNSLRLLVKNASNYLETVDIEDIPLKRWTNVVFTVADTYLEVYIDGKLTISKNLKNSPSFNSGSLIVNNNDGFDGLISSLNYYPRTLTPKEISRYYGRGPTGQLWFEYYWSRLYHWGHPIDEIVDSLPSQQDTLASD